MEWVLALAVGALAATWWASRRRQHGQQRLEHDQVFRQVRKVADEDVTRFGEELQELHIDTLTTELDVAMRQDYQRALDAYENAKSQLADATRPEDVTEVTKTLEDGRYAKACVLARQAGEPLPQRRPPCFFNPAHGPAQTDAEWAPPGGIRREIPVCLADADRLAQGAEPDVRKVRSGSQMVPWWQGGPAYGAWAGGYYASYAYAGLFPGFILGSMMGSPVVVDGDSGGSDTEGTEGTEGADSSGDDWTGWEGDAGAAGAGGADLGGADPGGADLGGADAGGAGDGGGGWFGGDSGGWGGFDGGGFGGDGGGM